MPAVHRIGDPNSGGGTVASTTQGTVFANGILISVNGSPVTDHGRGVHDAPTTASGSATVFINGIPVNRAGDSDTCGHQRTSGSPNVNVG